MNYDRVLIKNNVKKMLKENWQTVLLVVILLSAIEIAIELVAMQNQAGGEFLSFIVRMPFDVAICSFLMWMMKNCEARTSDFFEPFSRFFKIYFGRCMGILMDIFVDIIADYTGNCQMLRLCHVSVYTGC